MLSENNSADAYVVKHKTRILVKCLRLYEAKFYDYQLTGAEILPANADFESLLYVFDWLSLIHVSSLVFYSKFLYQKIVVIVTEI